MSLNMQQQAEHVGSAADKMRYGASQSGTVTEHRIPNPMLCGLWVRYMDSRVAKTRLFYCSVNSTEIFVHEM